MMSMKTSYRELDYAYGVAMQKLRNAMGLTQAGLANRLGVSWRTVAGWEAGSSYPRAGHLKELIALAVQQQAFAIGHEAEEIRVLWKVAHQKTWIDEHWLSELLDQWSCPQGQALWLRPRVESEPVEETTTTAQVTEAACQPQERSHERLPEAGIAGAPPRLPDGGFSQTPSETNADQPQGSPIVGAGLDGGKPYPSQGISHSEIPDQTMIEKFLHRSGGIGAEHDPHSSHPETDKTRGRRKWLMPILIALVIVTIIGSAGTLFFLAREQAYKTAADQTYPRYLSGHGTLVFFDPLGQQDGSRWTQSTSIDGGSCQFTGGTYHIRQQPGYYAWCSANGIFSNFAFEVQLTITQGDCGGMTFRDGDKNGYYYFRICQDSAYEVHKYFSYSGPDYTVIQSSRSSAIRTGLGQQNKMAVVASGSAMTFYVNEQQIDQEQDSSYTWGHIALIATPYYGHVTDVAYSNAKLWTL
jgi:transcriptional regulator with XRE-family HTH domain